MSKLLFGVLRCQYHREGLTSSGNPRSYARRGAEQRAQESIEQQKTQAEAWAQGAFGMTLDELYLYEETALPRIIRDHEGFDETEYYNNLAENYEYDTTRESEGTGRGGEILQGEQSVPATRTPAVGERREGRAVSNDVQGGSQNGIAQKETDQVNETISQGTDQVSDQDTATEGDAPGQNGVLLSDEVDENGRQFVLNSKGEIIFGEILEDSGLTPAPILLSEGLITNPATNDGYGLVHIEARHGDQIRNAGYNSVVEFVEEVAKNYEVIREGKDRNGQQTYMLQLTDKHNNTLMVELSGDGTYWNINTAGIFKTSYGKNRKEVYNRHTTAKQPTETVEASQDAEQSGTQATSSMNTPTTSSASEDTAQVSNSQKNAQKSGEKSEEIRDKSEEESEKMYSQEELAEVKEQLGELNAMRAPAFAVRLFSIKPWGTLKEANAALKELLASYGEMLNGQTAAVLPFLDKAQELINGYNEIQEPRSVREELDNGDKRITNYNSRGEVETVATERDGRIVAVDSYDEGVLFEHTEYDDKGRASSVTRYDMDGNAIGTRTYVNDVESGAYVRETMRTVPLRARAELWMKDTGVRVRLLGVGDEITNRAAREAVKQGATGWIDNNEVVLYLPNIRDAKEVDDTFVHEVVAHMGLKALMGEDFDALCDRVWEMMSEEQKARYIDYLGVNGDTRKAADEYMAHLAEDVDLTEQDKSVWQRIVDAVREFLVKHGFKMADRDIENLVRASYANLKEQRGKSKDTQFRIAEVNERFNKELQQQIDGTLPKGHIYELGMPSEVLISTGIPELPIQLNSTKLQEKSTSYGHDYSLEEIKDLVIALHNPLAVFAYGDKTKAQNIVVEIQSNDKNFVIGLALRPKIGGRVLEINSIRNVFPKDNAEWLNWISQGKALYLDKERVQTLIDQQRTSLADVDYLDLNSIANVINNFENPSIEDDFYAREGNGPLTDREVTMESDIYSKVLGKPRYTGKKQREYVARMRDRMVKTANELAEKLNTVIEVRETTDGLTGKKAKAKGWYDTKTGKVVVVVSNHGSVQDIVATVLHEVVAHKGLRKMFGEYFDTFLDNVYNNADSEVKTGIDVLAEKHGGDIRVATEEYLAELAENTYFEKVDPSLWERIKQWFMNMLAEVDVRLGGELSDNELRYILWRSYRNLSSPGLYNPIERITDTAVRAQLGIGEYTPVTNNLAQVAVEKRGIVAPDLNDAVVNVVDVPRHDFTGNLKEARTKAREWAIENYAGKEFDLPENAGKYIISKNAIGKYLDKSAFDKSDNATVHLSALKVLPEIISNSIEAEIHPDYAKGENGARSAENGINRNDLLVHRIYGAINIDGKTYRVKTTIHEFKDSNTATTPHSYEVTEIELIEDSTVTPYDGIDNPLNRSVNSISATKLLDGVEKSYDKGKKVLDESEISSDIRFRVVGGNSGYVGYSMSKRAEQARAEGRYPKTDFKKVYGVSGESFDLLKEAGIIYISEWHHTSKFGNKSDFYSWNEPWMFELYNEQKDKIRSLVRSLKKEPVFKDFDDTQEGYDAYIEADKEYRTNRNKIIDKIEDLFYSQENEYKAKLEAREREQQRVLMEKRAYEDYVDSLKVPAEYIAKNGARVVTYGKTKPYIWKVFWGENPAFKKYAREATEELKEYLRSYEGEMPISFEQWKEQQEKKDDDVRYRMGSRVDDIQNKNVTLHKTKDGRVVRYEQLELFNTDERTDTDIQRNTSEGNRTDDNGAGNDNLQRGDFARGNAFAQINVPLRPLKEGETSLVQRIFTKSKSFDFTAGEQIESLEDVAYIFRNLEDESIENSFAVLVKDGKPTVIHLGMGAYTSTIINTTAVAVAMENIKPEKVYFVHNHPSGALKASANDVAILQNFRTSYGDIVEKGIIINLKSGKFGIYDIAQATSEERNSKKGNDSDIPVEIFTFNKQVFDKDFNPAELYHIGDASDVAAFVSSHRLGSRNKVGLLVCNNQLKVVGNVFTPFIGINSASAKKIAKEIVYYTTVMGGNRPVLFGRFPVLSRTAKSNLEFYINSYSGGMIKLLDLVDVESSESVLNEDGETYGDTRFRMGSRVDARMAEVASHFEGRDLNAEQRTVVDVFGGKADNLTINIKTQDGNERKVVMRQGNEMGAGAKHSLYRHYNTGSGTITADDVLLIPDVIAFGERTENKRGNTRLAVYRLTDDNGTRFTVVTEVKEKGEVFNDFYTNKKALNQTPQMPNGDTQLSARTNDLNASEDKGSDNSLNTQEDEARFRAVKEQAQRQDADEVDMVTEAVNGLGQKLNTQITVVDDVDSLPEDRRNKKGWYDTRTGQVVVVMSNHVSAEDVMQTVLHEVVGHKGLRVVMGDKLGEFLDSVFRNLPKGTQSRINGHVLSQVMNGRNMTRHVATEEYIAEPQKLEEKLLGFDSK